MTFSKSSIEELLRTSVFHRKELEEVYALLPTTHCRRTTCCCSMLPEITLVEALTAIECLAGMAPLDQRGLMKSIIEYFFLNPVQITSCPFLNGQECLIYWGRFFGCRAYGLWSKKYYKELTAKNRQGKLFLRRNWENLGVFLPKQVIDYEVPYCIHIETDGRSTADDSVLLEVSHRIEKISGCLAPWHESFRSDYFSDLSFLIASLIYGVRDAVQMKFDIVREIITQKETARLDEALNALYDFSTCAGE